MKRAKIITHYGKAHRDEFLACCVILFHEYRIGRMGFVERRVISAADLASPDIWVVDSGGIYNPSNLNFDHHNMNDETCALDMVLRHILGDATYETYRAVSPWLKNTAIQDSSGAKVASERLNIDLNAYMSTRSPIEKFVLERFAETMVIHAESHLALLMRDIGRMIITGAEQVNGELPDMINNTPSPVDHNGVRLWDIRSLTTDDATALAVINQAAHARGVDIMISAAGKVGGGGFGLYRQAWAKDKVDFMLIKDHALVKFAHKNGYYAVISPEADDNTIMEIVTLAIPKPNAGR